MIHINSTIVIVILNPNGLNIPITRQTLVNMAKKRLQLTIKGRREHIMLTGIKRKVK